MRLWTGPAQVAWLTIGLALFLGDACRAAEAFCTPEDWQDKGLLSAPVQEPGDDRSTKAGSRVLFDVSGSMRGYVAPGLKHALLQELLWAVPDAVESISGSARYSRFGTRVVEAKKEDLPNLAKPSAYSCSQAENCINQDSQIGTALAEVMAGSPKDVHAVITDLFVSRAELAASGSQSILPAFRQAMQQGRSVGVLGVLGSFSGTVYDLPNNGRNLKQVDGFRGERPLFVFLIGPPQKVVAVKRRLETYLLKSVDRERWHFSIFLGSLAGTVGVVDVMEKATFGRGVRRVSFRSGAAPGPDLFRVERRHDPIRAVMAAGSVLGDLAADLPWFENVAVRTGIWAAALKSDGCSGAWELIADPASPRADGRHGRAIADPEGSKIELFGSLPFPIGLRLAVDVEVVGQGIGTRHERAGWLKNWSFGDPGRPNADAVLACLAPLKGSAPDCPKGMEAFPVLNLGRLGEVLLDIEAEVFRPVRLGRGRLLLEIAP